jgi:hypothetical protein
MENNKKKLNPSLNVLHVEDTLKKGFRYLEGEWGRFIRVIYFPNQMLYSVAMKEFHKTLTTSVLKCNNHYG